MARLVGFAALACAIGALAPAAQAKPTAKQLAPGVYQGQGKLTGGFTGPNFTVAIKGGGQFRFCAHASKTGLVSPYKSHWAIEPTTITVDETNGSGTGRGDMDGFGMFGGYVKKHGKLYLAISGVERLHETLDIYGYTFEESYSFPLLSDLPVDHLTANGWTGDLVLGARQAQQSQGFASTERAPYTAHRVQSCVINDPPSP